VFLENKPASGHKFLMIKVFATMVGLAVLHQPAFAAQSDWVESEGGAMRLVVTDNGKSSARGVLEIRLNPGWKTYWREPGDGGIPPSLMGDGMAVELLFPAPDRISENGSTFSGYHVGVGLPFVLPETLMPVEKLTAFIGICSDICVPFQAEFSLLRDSKDAEIVDAAFSKLPKPASENEGVSVKTRDGQNLVLTSATPNSELFLAPEKGVYLSIPVSTETGFAVKILKERTSRVKVHYTLKTGGTAVSGTLEMPQ
jgi:DsbC/DsbD-like thiol-disulfide interchange protein